MVTWSKYSSCDIPEEAAVAAPTAAQFAQAQTLAAAPKQGVDQGKQPASKKNTERRPNSKKRSGHNAHWASDAMPSQHSSTGHKRIRKKEKKPSRPKPPAATAAAGVIDLADDDDDMPPLEYADSDGDGEGEDQFLSQFDDVFADYLGLGTGGAGGGGGGLDPLLGLEPLADGPGIMDVFTGLAADGLGLKASGSVVAKTGGQSDRTMRTHLATAKALVSPKHKRKQMT